MKKLGNKVRNFSRDAWRHEDRAIAYRAVYAIFSQNATLKNILLNSGDRLITESSGDMHWGTGLHLYDRNTLNKQHWKNANGGVMCSIFKQVHNELRN